MLLRVAALSLAAIALFPGVLGAYRLIIAVRERVRAHPGSYCKGDIARIQAFCAAIVLAVGLAASLAWYPCTMTNDSFGHWTTAISDSLATDYNPLAFTLLLRVLLGGSASPYPYVLLQVALMAALAGDAAGFLARCGVPRRAIAACAIVFAFVPSSFTLPLYFSKNPLSCLLCASLTLSLAEAVSLPEEYSGRPLFWLKASAVAAGLFLVRENNAVIVAALAAMVVWALLRKASFRRGLVAVCGMAAVLICAVNAGAYASIEHTHVDKSHETVRPLLAPAASALKQGLELPGEVDELMERVLPREEWIERYSPTNSDYLTWGDPRPDYASVSLGEAFSAYLEMLSTHPAVVAQDRLDATRIIWDVNGTAGMVRFPSGIEGNVTAAEKPAFVADEGFKGAGGAAQKVSEELRKLFGSLAGMSVEAPVVDTLVWRCGPYIVLLLILAAVLVEEKRARLLWAIAPSCLILVTYMLVIAWQQYYYVWFFPLSVIVLFLATIAAPTLANSVSTQRVAEPLPA